jgi:hypothetical protein
VQSVHNEPEEKRDFRRRDTGIVSFDPPAPRPFFAHVASFFVLSRLRRTGRSARLRSIRPLLRPYSAQVAAKRYASQELLAPKGFAVLMVFDGICGTLLKSGLLV